MLRASGLSGLPFVGSDIGGFADSAIAELFTRWLQTGVFYPFMRTHTAFGTADQEPWSYGVAHEDVNRRAIELRYRLLPHIYNVMQRGERDRRCPRCGRCFLEYPSDGRDLGSGRPVPVRRRPARRPRAARRRPPARASTCPRGRGTTSGQDDAYAGGSDHSIPVTLRSIPIFVRAGAFIFQQPVVQHTGEMPGQPLRVSVYPAESSTSTLYEDDGATLQYRQGAFSKRKFTQARERIRAPDATAPRSRSRRLKGHIGRPHAHWYCRSNGSGMRLASPWRRPAAQRQRCKSSRRTNSKGSPEDGRLGKTASSS